MEETGEVRALKRKEFGCDSRGNVFQWTDSESTCANYKLLRITEITDTARAFGVDRTLFLLGVGISETPLSDRFDEFNW